MLRIVAGELFPARERQGCQRAWRVQESCGHRHHPLAPNAPLTGMQAMIELAAARCRGVPVTARLRPASSDSIQCSAPPASWPLTAEPCSEPEADPSGSSSPPSSSTVCRSCTDAVSQSDSSSVASASPPSRPFASSPGAASSRSQSRLAPAISCSRRRRTSASRAASPEAGCRQVRGEEVSAGSEVQSAGRGSEAMQRTGCREQLASLNSPSATRDSGLASSRAAAGRWGGKGRLSRVQHESSGVQRRVARRQRAPPTKHCRYRHPRLPSFFWPPGR